VKIFSIGVFGLFVIGALAANWRYFLDYVGFVVIAVFLHNGLALITGYFAASSPACPSATGARCRSRSASRIRRWA
jgi:BASS family bile acid:Na+ symporter